MALVQQPYGVRPLSLRANFFWSLVGSIGSAASQWAIIVLLAKLGTATMVGIYTFALAVVAPIILFAQLNLRRIQAVHQEGEYYFSDFFAVRASGSIVALVGIGMYAIVTREDALTNQVILLVALGKTIDGFSDVTHGLFQRRERLDRQAQSLLIRGVLQLCGLWSALVLTGSVIWAATGLVLASLAVGLLFDLNSARRMLSDSAAAIASGRTAVRIRLARNALPLGIVAVLGSLYQNIPRYAIADSLGLIAVGYFSAIFYLTYVGFTIVASLGAAFSPRLAAYYLRDRGRFGNLAFCLTLLGAAVGMVGALIAFMAGPAVLTLVYRPEYAKYASTLEWVMISAVIWYAATVLSYCAVAAKRFASLAYLHALAAGTTWMLCPSLISRYGLPGAAMALAAGVLLLFLGELVVVWRAMRGTLHFGV